MTSASYFLSLADLHSAAPGVLDVVFGPDGDFEWAPPARLTVFVAQPVWTERGERPGTYGILVGPDPDQSGWWLIAGVMKNPRLVISLPESNLALDLRVPSVAARLAGLCLMVVEGDRIIFDGSSPIYTGEFLRAAMCSPSAGGFDPALAAELAALTLSLAPRIAALRRTP